MPSTASETPISSASLSILIVDDFRDSADSLADLLRLCGHSVQTAYDAPMALAAERPDVVILELGLRGTNGWELVEQMRVRFTDRRPAFIAVTTCGLDRDRRRSAEVGIDPHLLKPVAPGALMDVLKQYAYLPAAAI